MNIEWKLNQGLQMLNITISLLPLLILGSCALETPHPRVFPVGTDHPDNIESRNLSPLKSRVFCQDQGLSPSTANNTSINSSFPMGNTTGTVRNGSCQQ